MTGTVGVLLGRALRIPAALAAAALVAGCGSSSEPPAGSTGPSGPTTTTATAPPCGVVGTSGVVVTPGQESCTVTAHPGATIHVVLDRGFRWDDPKSDSGAVVVGGIVRPPGGGLAADLRAVAVGRATVTSVGAVACPTGQPCPALARLWSVHVIVAGATISERTTTATQVDSGRSYTLRKGDHLDVELVGPSNYTWSEPTTSDQGVLRPVASTPGSTAAADFLAVGTGHARVSAIDNPNCYPQCLAPSRQFGVSASVAG